MAKYLREVTSKKAAVGGENTSEKGEVNIDDLNASPGNRDFAAKHKTQKWADRNGNDDDVFKGKTKQVKHGYQSPEDQKVYESKSMKCESCGKMYESDSCGCGGKSVPEAKPGKKGMLVDKKKLSEMLSVTEGKKVDRMVKHIEKNEKESGHDDEKAENIAWATANKRGMLDNKNKKAGR
jgi:hypothetical protein